VSDVFVGLLAVSYSLAQFGAAPVLGRLSDRCGRRPVLLLSGSAGGNIAAAGFSFLAFGATAVALSEPDRARDAAARPTFVGQLRGALDDRTLRPLVVAFFLTSLAFAGVTVMFVPLLADSFECDATAAAAFLAYIGALGIVNQGFLIGRLSRAIGVRRVVRVGVAALFAALVLLAAAPLAGTAPVGLAALVSEGATADTQGAAFGVTQAAGSLGRTVGPPLAAAAYVAVYWSLFVAGALLLTPVAVLLRR
jgi:MFS family permease